MTTRFLYITDTHWGAVPDKGWSVQPRDPAKFDRVHEALKQWLSRQDPPVDFVLHGGDVVDDGSTAQIVHATGKLAELEATGPRVLLCLGNHDLEKPESMAHWRLHHNGMLPDDSGSYVVTFDALHLYVLTHHWNTIDPPHYWHREAGQTPLLDDEQRETFERFASSADRPVVVAVHAPAQSVPPSQSGLAVDMHVPDAAWRAYLLGVIDRFPAIRLVLTAHAHVHTLRQEKQCVVAGTSALFETPFEAKLITVNDHTFEMQTLCLGEMFGIQGQYRQDKAFAQGKAQQRTASWSSEM